MSSKRSLAVTAIVFVLLLRGLQFGAAQNASTPTTGYAVKKPVFGGACPICPWGAMAEVVKTAMKPYGWESLAQRSSDAEGAD
jgi:hypothetical protein